MHRWSRCQPVGASDHRTRRRCRWSASCAARRSCAPCVPRHSRSTRAASTTRLLMYGVQPFRRHGAPVELAAWRHGPISLHELIWDGIPIHGWGNWWARVGLLPWLQGDISNGHARASVLRNFVRRLRACTADDAGNVIFLNSDCPRCLGGSTNKLYHQPSAASVGSLRFTNLRLSSSARAPSTHPSHPLSRSMRMNLHPIRGCCTGKHNYTAVGQ